MLDFVALILLMITGLVEHDPDFKSNDEGGPSPVSFESAEDSLATTHNLFSLQMLEVSDISMHQNDPQLDTDWHYADDYYYQGVIGSVINYIFDFITDNSVVNFIINSTFGRQETATMKFFLNQKGAPFFKDVAEKYEKIYLAVLAVIRETMTSLVSRLRKGYNNGETDIYA